MPERFHTVRYFTVAAWTAPGNNQLTGIDFSDAANVSALAGVVPVAGNTVAVVCTPDEAELVLGVVQP